MLLLETKKHLVWFNIDSKLFKLVASFIAAPITHILNLSFNKGVCPQTWKIAKFVPLPKNTTVPFYGPNSRPISLLPALSKIMERIVFEQIQNNLYRCSTCIQNWAFNIYYGPVWLTALDNRRLAGAVLLDLTQLLILLITTFC